jgi:hypothetical protein
VANSDQKNKEAKITHDTPSVSASNDDAYGHTKTSMDRTLAQALERQFTEVLDWVYRYSDPAITIADRGECLDILFRMPFYFPEPDYDYGAWLATRRAQAKLRRGFIAYLRKPEVIKDLSDFFFTTLAKFLLEFKGVSRYGATIEKHLRRIAQKRLAGRRHHSIHKNTAMQIKREGIKIHQVIQEIQQSIAHWKKSDGTSTINPS